MQERRHERRRSALSGPQAYLLGSSWRPGAGRCSPYTLSSCRRPTRCATASTGARTSVRRSMGITPAAGQGWGWVGGRGVGVVWWAVSGRVQRLATACARGAGSGQGTCRPWRGSQRAVGATCTRHNGGGWVPAATCVFCDRRLAASPAATISALLFAYCGSTRPGQSQRQSDGVTFRVCTAGGQRDAGRGGGGSAHAACGAQARAMPCRLPRLLRPVACRLRARRSGARRRRLRVRAQRARPAGPPRGACRGRMRGACRPAYLEVLGLAGGGRHGRLLGAKQGVNGGRLAHVGIPRESHHEALATARLHMQGGDSSQRLASRQPPAGWRREAEESTAAPLAQSAPAAGKPAGSAAGRERHAAAPTDGPTGAGAGAGCQAHGGASHCLPAPRPAPLHLPPPWLPAPPAAPASRPPPAPARVGRCRASAAPAPQRARRRLHGGARLGGASRDAPFGRSRAIGPEASRRQSTYSSPAGAWQSSPFQNSTSTHTRRPGAATLPPLPPPRYARTRARARTQLPAPDGPAPVECSSMPALADQNT